jgi:hypothetical protein
MRQYEPPLVAPPAASALRIGKDSHGNCRQMALRPFVDRLEALKFAMYENGNPQAVIMVPGILELDLNAKPHRIHQADHRDATRSRVPPSASLVRL